LFYPLINANFDLELHAKIITKLFMFEQRFLLCFLPIKYVIKKDNGKSIYFLVLLTGSHKYCREYLCANENIIGIIFGYCSWPQLLSIYA